MYESQTYLTNYKDVKSHMIVKDHTSEAGHWYTRDGEPMYTIMGKTTGRLRNTTLKDARELNLIPSVTTLLNTLAKPNLEKWKMENMLLAALTLPRMETESEAVYLQRIIQDSKQTGRDAADKGTEIHAAIQAFYEGKTSSRYPRHVQACKNALESHFGALDWISERSFGHELGFGGKCDLYSPSGIVVDIKSKEFDDVSKVTTYEEMGMQLAAYRVGLGLPSARCANVFVSRTNPDLAVVIEWDQEDLKKSWEMFICILKFWQIRNSHE